ncbi:MAG: ABC transporter substrate-binding protein [Pseudomonadota bacterium]
MQRLSVILILVLIFLFSAGTRLGHAEEVRGVSDDTVKIGVIMDQTGPAGAIGMLIAEATRIYFRHINDQGGIEGRKVKVIVEDDRYSIPGAIAAFKKLIFKDKVLSLLYCGGTGQTLALTRQIEKNKVPIVALSLSEAMTTPVRRYIFTPSASYQDGFQVIIDYIMKDLGAKDPKIAFIYPDVEFGKTGLRATEKYLPKYNLKLSSREVLTLGAIEATSQVMNLKKSKPDYIIVHTGTATLIAFLRGAKKFGLKSKMIGSFYVSSEDTVAIAGDSSKDLIAISPFGYWSDDTPGMIQLRDITKQYQPDTKLKIRHYTQGWITAMICAEGLRKAGRNLTPDTLVEAYETFKDFSTGEISAPVSYSKTNHKGGRANRFYRTDVERQTWIPITGFREPVHQD